MCNDIIVSFIKRLNISKNNFSSRTMNLVKDQRNPKLPDEMYEILIANCRYSISRSLSNFQEIFLLKRFQVSEFVEMQ